MKRTVSTTWLSIANRLNNITKKKKKIAIICMSGSKEPIAQTNMLNAIWELQCCMSTFSQPTNILIFFTLDIKYFIFELSFLQIVHYKRPLWFAYVSRVFHMVLLCSVFIPAYVEMVLYGLCVARFLREKKKKQNRTLNEHLLYSRVSSKTVEWYKAWSKVS